MPPKRSPRRCDCHCTFPVKAVSSQSIPFQGVPRKRQGWRPSEGWPATESTSCRVTHHCAGEQTPRHRHSQCSLFCSCLSMLIGMHCSVELWHFCLPRGCTIGRYQGRDVAPRAGTMAIHWKRYRVVQDLGRLDGQKLSPSSLEWLLDTVTNSSADAASRAVLQKLLLSHWHLRLFAPGTLAVAPLLGRRIIFEVRSRCLRPNGLYACHNRAAGAAQHILHTACTPMSDDDLATAWSMQQAGVLR